MPNFVLDAIDVKIVEILLFMSASIQHERTSLMQYKISELPGNGRIALKFLSFPIVAFKIEAPESSNIGAVGVVPSSEEVHHIVIDGDGVGVDMTEGNIVEEMGLNFGPYFRHVVIAVYN